MKILKKILKVILSNILFLLILVLFFSINLKYVINNAIVSDIIKSTVSLEASRLFVDDQDIVTQQNIENIKEKLQDNKSVSEFINKYTDITFNSLAGRNIDEVNFKQDVRKVIIDNKSIIEDEYNIKITDDDINKVIDKVDDEVDLDSKYKEAIKITRNNLSNEQKQVLSIYGIITSIKFYLIIILSIVLVTVILALVQQSFYKWLFNLSTSVLISSIICGILFICFSIFMNKSLSDINTKINISLLKSVTIPLVGLVISVLLFIIYNLFKKKDMRSNVNEK